MRYARDPFGASLRALARYGDPYTAPSVFGPQVVTADPEVVAAVFAADPTLFAATGAAVLGPVMGESSVILIDGERHRAARKLLAPPFHRAAIAKLGDAIAVLARERIAALPRGRPFDLHHTLREITSDVIVRIVFGATDPRDARALTAQLFEVASALRPTFLLMPAFRRRLAGLSAWARFQRACARSQALVAEHIAHRRGAPPADDVLGLLLASRDAAGEPPSDREVWEQLMTFFMAGHDTTASTLTWAVQLVHRDPAICDRLRSEVAGADAGALAALPYLEAACSETLRLCPIAPFIARDLRQPFSVGGYEVPAGTGLAISIIGIHRRPDLYPEPDRFDPDRFAGGRSYTPSQFLPFGGGARRCLGAALAMLELKVVLGTVMQAPLRLIDDGQIRATVRNTTVGPRRRIAAVLD